MTYDLESSKENPANKTRHTIILVEPDVILCEILSMALEEMGYDVQFFTNGRDAKEYIFKENNYKTISLMIIERLLPDMDGIILLEEIGIKHGVPILIASILSAEKDIIDGIKNGAIDYIVKPFSLPVFITKINAFIATYKKKSTPT